MDQLKREIEANFDKFSEDWKQKMLEAMADLDKSQDIYLKSYARLTSLQTWRNHLDSRISSGSLAFFLEAQNDALVSHVLARLGSWRSALKSLRSCIENTLFCLFYMDHPIELQQWHLGAHRLGFTETITYFERHPQVITVNLQLTGIPRLKEEYSTLSKAVHGSAKSFRMTVDVQSTLLWSQVVSHLGAWATREQRTVASLNLLLLTLFRDQLHGTSFLDLRRTVSLAVPTQKYPQIRAELGISLPRS